MPRQRKSFRADFHLAVYTKLLRLRTEDSEGRLESCVEVIERLILQAPEVDAQVSVQ